MADLAFALEGVGKAFDDAPALESVDLEIEVGEAVAFVGPSGAGKTTLLRMLNGSLRPDTGCVRVNGHDLATLSRRATRTLRTSIGVVHQDLSLVPNLRVVQNVLAGRLGRMGLLTSLKRMIRPGRSDLREIHAILERVGIEEKLFERTDRLSGGQQQRVALARALFQAPTALIADEPVSSVDPARARDTVELLTRISREERLTLCVSLHSLELARRCFPRLVGLREGRVLFDCESDAVGDAELEALYDFESTETA